MSAQNSSPPMRNARPSRAEAAAEAHAEAHEQGVAGGVAEGVVVVLEAVEVEEGEHQRRLGRVAFSTRRASSRVSARRLPEPGQRVRVRLLARGAQHADVLAEGEQRAGHQGQQRGGREPDGERRCPRAPAGDQQPEADRAEQQRHDDPAHALVGVRDDAVGAAARPPRRSRTMPSHQPMSNHEPGRVGAVDVPDEVERVGEPEGRRCRARAAPTSGPCASRCRRARRRPRRAGRGPRAG